MWISKKFFSHNKVDVAVEDRGKPSTVPTPNFLASLTNLFFVDCMHGSSRGGASPRPRSIRFKVRHLHNLAFVAFSRHRTTRWHNKSRVRVFENPRDAAFIWHCGARLANGGFDAIRPSHFGKISTQYLTSRPRVQYAVVGITVLDKNELKITNPFCLKKSFCTYFQYYVKNCFLPVTNWLVESALVRQTRVQIPAVN